MKLAEAFPSKYLSAADLGNTEPTYTISHVDRAQFTDRNGRPEEKSIVHFHNVEKGLVLNKTNWETIAYIHKTDETDEWPGKPIKLCTELVRNPQGKMIPAIRVKAPARAMPSQQPPKPVHIPPHVEAKTGPTPPIEAYEDIGF